jgi:hypothetical protein
MHARIRGKLIPINRAEFANDRDNSPQPLLTEIKAAADGELEG